MKVWVEVEIVRDTRYGHFGVAERVQEAGGELVQADEPPPNAWSPRAGLYCVDTHRWHLSVEILRHCIPKLSPALAGAFVDLERNSVLAGLEVWTEDRTERLWPRPAREPWERAPGWWRDSDAGPGPGPAGGDTDTFAGGSWW